jgi:hypothetical protein
LCAFDISDIRLLSEVLVDNALTRFPLRFKHFLPMGEGRDEGTSERGLF